jgi:putative acetyltransferase
MDIKETTPADLGSILLVERAAFGTDSEAELTQNLLADPSAQPLTSLLALVEGQPVGHVLFTKARLSGAPEVSVSILAPLAVVPRFQKRGVGGCLIKRGLELLSGANVDLVFVIGWPNYYPRYGFTPAGRLGFEPPFPVPEKDADAWMVQALQPNIIGKVSGKVICCDALNKPEYWRE